MKLLYCKAEIQSIVYIVQKRERKKIERERNTNIIE